MMKPRSLRSQAWFARHDRQGTEHRGMMRALGLTNEDFNGKPIIGICSVWSELSPCDIGLKNLAQRVKAGIWAAGGVPLVFPAPAIGEPLMRPSPMMYRNLTSMVVEETLRANPLDGVVLLAGCDKSTPALLMAALSVDLPAVLLSSGPRNSSRFRGETVGAGTNIWRMEQALAEGRWKLTDATESEASMGSSIGTCNTMGTASTMAAIAEVLGFSLPDNATLGATDARRMTLAEKTGRTIVEAVNNDRRPSTFLTRASFINAIRVVAALGGSTNAVPHLLAIAGRSEIPLSLDDWDSAGRDVPCIVDLLPSGQFLMQDFHDAGGLAVVCQRLLAAGLLDGAAATVDNSTLAARVAQAQCWNDTVIRTLKNPLYAQGGLCILKGNICPAGAVIKPSAATPALLQHTGKAWVFDGIEAWKQAASDPGCAIAANDVVVVRGCGPVGYPGMPEVGNVRIPDTLARQGVKDLIRISDARMSGTAFGTVILHVSPESAIGGPLACLVTGDQITLNVANRTLNVLIDAAELQKRQQQLSVSNAAPHSQGYSWLYQQHVQQADQGADFDFLRGKRGSTVPRDST